MTYLIAGWDVSVNWWIGGSAWSYDYDLLDRKVKETTALGFDYSWTYDEVSNLVEYTDASNQTTTYKYDGLNRLTNLTLPGDVQINITYYLTEKERQDYTYPPIIIFLGDGLPQDPTMEWPPRMSVLEKEYDLLGRVIREMWAVTDMDGYIVGDTSFYKALLKNYF